MTTKHEELLEKFVRECGDGSSGVEMSADDARALARAVRALLDEVKTRR